MLSSLFLVFFYYIFGIWKHFWFELSWLSLAKSINVCGTRKKHTTWYIVYYILYTAHDNLVVVFFYVSPMTVRILRLCVLYHKKSHSEKQWRKYGNIFGCVCIKFSYGGALKSFHSIGLRLSFSLPTMNLVNFFISLIIYVWTARKVSNREFVLWNGWLTSSNCQHTIKLLSAFDSLSWLLCFYFMLSVHIDINNLQWTLFFVFCFC